MDFLYGVTSGSPHIPESSGTRIYSDLDMARKELSDDLVWKAVIGNNAAAYEQ